MSELEGGGMSDDLMRRLVKCPGWRWFRHLLMRADDGGVYDVHYVSETGAPVHDAYMEHGGWVKTVGGIPVATDPFLPGWTLLLVRKASGDPYAHTCPVDDHGRRRWICRYLRPGDGPFHTRLVDIHGDTELEAVTAALVDVDEWTGLARALPDEWPEPDAATCRRGCA